MAQNQTGKETVVPVKPPFKKPFKRPKRLRTGYEELSGYAFISPFIIGLVAFTLYPIVYSLYLSFTNYGMGENMNGLD